MPLSRIIIAGVNVLAAIVFMWLASADWGKRHLWSHAVYRYDLALQGLPVDDAEIDENGEPLVSKLSEGNLKLIFKSTPVKTQKEAVENRYKQLRGEIDAASDENARRQRLETLMRDLARTTSERENYAAMKADDLSAAFDAAFSEARTGKSSTGTDLNRDQWRRAIAHVLFSVDDRPEEQDRLLSILGLRSYTRAADQRAGALREMDNRVQQAMTSDRAAYEIQHRRLVQQILLLAERVADLKGTLQQHRELNDKHQKLVEERKGSVKEFEGKLAIAEADLSKALEEQGALEKDLFDTQRALGRASEQNQQLEKDIRAREQGK